MKRNICRTRYFIFNAVALFAGLDAIFFQPLTPGKLIGVGCLSSIALLLCQTKRRKNQ